MTDQKNPVHLNADELPWGDYSAWYSDEMMTCMRAKRLVGPGGVIDSDQTVFGLLEIDPGGRYPAHRHAAPEIYYVLSGRAECRFGDEIFEAGPGSVIRTPPNVWHSFRTLGDAPFRAVAYWYAEPADPQALRCDLELPDDANP